MTPWGVSMVFAVGVAVLLAAAGFNRPTWSRTYTTAWRYWTANCAHIGLYLILYTLCYGILLRLIGASDYGTRTALLWLSLGVVACVRAIPPVARALRDRLHRIAGIPDQAQSLARFLANTPFKADDNITALAKDTLRVRGIDVDANWLPRAGALHRQMLTATEVFIQLRTWDQTPSFRPFIREVSHELYRLRQRFDRTSFRASRTLESIEQLGEIKAIASEDGLTDSTHIDASLRHLVNNMIADVCEDVSLFHRDACMLIARGLLTRHARRRDRDAALVHMGFTACTEERTSVARTYGYAALLLFAGLWAFFIVLPPDDDAGLSISQRITVISVIVMGTMAIAGLPKFYFGFASGGLQRRTPVAFVIAAGVVALAFAVLVNLAAGALIYGGAAGALRRLGEGAPYLPSTLMTGVVVAWLTQDHRWASVDKAGTRRLRDAGVFGLCWLLSTLISRWILADQPGEFLNWKTALVCVIGMALGAAMGALIPEFLRKSREPARLGDLVVPHGYTPTSPIRPAHPEGAKPGLMA